MLRKSVTLPGFIAAAFFTWSTASLLINFYHMRIFADTSAICTLLVLALLFAVFYDKRTLLISGALAAAGVVGFLAYGYTHPGYLAERLERFSWFLGELADFFAFHGSIGYEDKYKWIFGLLICFVFAIPSLLLFGRLKGALILGSAGVIYFILIWIYGVNQYFPQLCAMASAILAVRVGSYARRQAQAYKPATSVDGAEAPPDGSGQQAAATREARNLAMIALPAVLLVAVIMVALSPSQAADLRNATFEAWMDDIFGVSGILENFWSPRYFFTLTEYGFNRHFGGPIRNNESPVYAVSTTTPLLLRATVKDVYTGSDWEKSGVPYREMRFHSPLTGGIRKEVFVEDFPVEPWGMDFMGIAESFLYSDIKYTVTLLGFRQRMEVMQSGRPTEFTSDDIDDFYPYFNTNSEVFFKWPVPPLSSYDVAEKHLEFSSPRFDAAVIAYERRIAIDKEDFELHGEEEDYENPFFAPDPYYEDMLARYTALPYEVTDEVREFVEQATEGIDSPYLQMVTLRDLIFEQTEYTEDVELLPEDREIVDWFLENRIGHCQHYATSMAVFARLLGIPSRYVEGFTTAGVSPDPESGAMIIRGTQAHTWCEIYLEGIGWIPVDATIPYNTLKEELALSTYRPILHTDEDLWSMMAKLLAEQTPPDMGPPPGESMPVISLQAILILAACLLVPTSILYGTIRLVQRRYKLKRLQKRHTPEETLLRYWRDMLRMLPYLHLTPRAGETTTKLGERAMARIALLEELAAQEATEDAYMAGALSGSEEAEQAGAVEESYSTGDLQKGESEDYKALLFDGVAFMETTALVVRSVYGRKSPEEEDLSLVYSLHQDMDGALLKQLRPFTYIRLRLRWK